MPTLKEIQSALYDIMKEIVKVCDRHGLTYYLSGGTLLGAVRHGGFIPWDDDVDLEMPWKDYKKFIRYAKKELPDHLFVQTFSSDPGYPNAFMMVRKSGTCAMPENAKGLGIHWGIEVDIFPIIGLYNNKKLRNFQLKRMRRISKILLIEYKKLAEPDTLKGDPVYEKYASYPLSRRIRICRMMLPFLTKSRRPETLGTVTLGLRDIFNAQDYRGSVKMKFEDAEFNVPVGYHNVLTTLYGDYMTPPPEDKRGGHELSMGALIWDLEKDYSCFK